LIVVLVLLSDFANPPIMAKEIVTDTAPKRIKYIQFGILSPQEIVAISEFEANQRDLYQPGGVGAERIPAKNGVLDRRLVHTSDRFPQTLAQ
jgi:DNA-directed RNA polymerase III subunit RPC1